MNDLWTREFDAVVVGSGPGGASVARELSRRGQEVLILERDGGRKRYTPELQGCPCITQSKSDAVA